MSVPGAWFWRRSRVLAFAPVVVMASVALSYANSRLVQPYWLDISSKATVAVVFLAPGLAAAAAMESRRLRPFSASSVGTRHPLALPLTILCQASIVGAVALALSLGIVAMRVGIPTGLPHVGVLALALLVAVASASFGALVGRYLPGVYSLTVAFATTWLWLTFPPTITPYWIRNVNGNVGASCCSTTLQLTDNALIAPGLVYAAVLVGVGLVMSIRRKWLAAIVALAMLGGALASARSMMLTTGPDPVEARKGATACAGEIPRVCLWPESATHVPLVVSLAQSTASKFTSAGLGVPDLFTVEEAVRGSWHIDLAYGEDQSWAWDISQAPLGGLPPACIESTNGRWRAGEVYDVVSLWLGEVAGAAPVRSPVPEVSEKVSHLRRLPSREQIAWVRANLIALRGCDSPPAPLPSP